MSSEQRRPEQKSDAGIPVAPAGERVRRGDEPVVTTPAVRVWEITLPPETEAALRVRGF